MFYLGALEVITINLRTSSFLEGWYMCVWLGDGRWGVGCGRRWRVGGGGVERVWEGVPKDHMLCTVYAPLPPSQSGMKSWYVTACYVVP